MVGEQVCREILAKVLGEDGDEEREGVSLAVGVSDSTLQQSGIVPQPSGAFAGALFVEIGGGIGRDKDRALIDAVVEKLRRGVHQRLAEQPTQQLAEDHVRVDRRLREAMKSLSKQRSELGKIFRQGGPGNSLSTDWFREQLTDLTRQDIEIDLDIHTDKTSLELLHEQLAKARADLNQSLTGREEARGGVAELEGQLRALGVRAQSDTTREDVEKLEARLGDLRRDLARRRVAEDTRSADAERATQRLEKLAVELQQTTLRLKRNESRRAALRGWIEQSERSLQKARTRERAQEDLRVAIEESENAVSSLREQSSDLAERDGFDRLGPRLHLAVAVCTEPQQTPTS